MKQPHVPEYIGGSTMPYIRTLAMFLKDFCLEAWKEIAEMKKRLEALEKGG